jgi:hypothetical protein
MKLREVPSDSWPEIDENQQDSRSSPIEVQHDVSTTIDLHSVLITPSTTNKDDPNQVYLDAEQTPTSTI